MSSLSWHPCIYRSPESSDFTGCMLVPGSLITAIYIAPIICAALCILYIPISPWAQGAYNLMSLSHIYTHTGANSPPSLERGRKPEYPEETRTGRPCKLHADREQRAPALQKRYKTVSLPPLYSPLWEKTSHIPHLMCVTTPATNIQCIHRVYSNTFQYYLVDTQKLHKEETKHINTRQREKNK